MGFVQRAVATVAVFAMAASGAAAFPGVLGKDREHARGHAVASNRKNGVPPAAAFGKMVAASVGAGSASVGSGAVSLTRAIVPAGPGTRLRGIDVSHYQGRIDWRRVARSGHHFAIAKATEGRTYVDQTYLRNKTLAEANGLAFGAYHFARPDPKPNDAVREANHFLDVARLEPGNVIPVLDLETTGGLSHRRLTRWILTWLRRVHERLGVRPMVYTSPVGWAERTGNTTAVAKAGYDVLWVAHWGVREPALPARNWAGNGWSLWQRSDCGSVPGIRGCVDVNRLAGPSIGAVTIDVADTRAPVVRISGPDTYTGSVVVSFDEVVQGASAQTLQLRSTDEGRRERARITCHSGIGWSVNCSTGDVRRVLLTPERPLVPGGGYEVVVNPHSPTRILTDRSGNLAPQTSRIFTAPTDLEQGSAPIAYERPRAWAFFGHGGGPGGRVAASDEAGADAEFTFRGTGVVWNTVRGPNHGIAQIWVDGRFVRTVDTYARVRTAGMAPRVTGLEWGIHTVRIVVLGESRGEATGSVVAVDGFSVLQRRVVRP
jgi:GH25 family lysozyme M1 (1,4-beta-N-acetylmuramidase)